MKKILGINELIDLNHLLQEKGLQFKLHINDACGSQSFSIESLAKENNEGDFDNMYKEIETFFAAKKMKIEYGLLKKTFILK